ncbi:MAG: sodium:solute symporter family transporter, partial [Aeoliella sp.]
PIDLAIIVVYLVGILSLGLMAGIRQRRQSGDAGYFLAGRSLTWPAIGLALFATNISTLELVSLAEEGYKRGLLYGNTEMLAPITLIILAIFFAPFYIRSGIETLPNFLEKRYSRGCRYWLVLFALGYAIFGHLGFALFTGGKVVEGLFDIPLIYGMAIILALTGVYTIVGGLKAVVWTEAVQTIILLAGMALLTAIAYNKVGGWSNFTAAMAEEPERLKLLRSDEAADDFKWYAVLLGYPVIGIWFWCTDQTIVQRVLGAKDENHAQVGALFAGFIKVAALFLFVFPGMFCYVLVSNGTLENLEDSAQTLPFMVSHLLPWGVRGLVAAAMLSALMSTVAGALNSTATVCCYDIYKQINPRATDRATIRFGRIVTFAAMLAAIAWAPFIQNFGSILEGNTMLIAYMAPSVTAVFLWGVFWRGASAAGAIGCLAAGALLGTAVFVLDFGFNVWFGNPWWTISFMMTSFYLFLICSAVLFILSKLWPQEQTAEGQQIVWDGPLAMFRAPGWPGIGNYKFLTVLLLAAVVAVYWVFR